jgi:cytochrome o ubiquinol oxidase operon protein cyoD
MSAPTHDHGHADHAASAHGSLKGYLTGFGLSVALTAVPFWLVMTGALPPQVTGLVVVGFAAVQIVVHMIYFLHMNGKAEGGWTILAMIFTVIIVVITLNGSLWVMSHLNTNMGPAHDMSDAP